LERERNGLSDWEGGREVNAQQRKKKKSGEATTKRKRSSFWGGERIVVRKTRNFYHLL